MKPLTPSPSPEKELPSPVIPQEGQYEIEDVVDYVNEVNGVGEMYLIKWKGWESEFNTWEPPCNLINCDDVLLRFYYVRKGEVEAQMAAQVFIQLPNGKRRRKGPEVWKIPPDPRPLEVRLQEFYNATKPLSEAKLKAKYLDWNRVRWANKGKDPRVRWNEAQINKHLVDGVDGKLNDQQMKDFRRELYYLEVVRLKDALDVKLKEWQVQINEVTRYKPEIKVENNVDFEGPPEGFEFVKDYIPSPGIVIPDDPPVGCECSESCYDDRKKCCSELSGARFAYNRFKKVAVPVGTPIFECNKRCSCGPECVNRVVQDGSNSEVTLSIFRTNNGCGWGVKALKPIKRGQFVSLYVGEVIYFEEAERRSKEDGQTTYLFDLDFNDEENPLYSVDASRFGNVAHFINHSCDPNLGVYTVWVNCLDPNLPMLAMFAIRDIARGEELSIDYTNKLSSETTEDDEEPQDSSPTREGGNNKKQICLCGADNCRKFLFA